MFAKKHKLNFKNKKNCSLTRQGFTLVELLLVMAIIGILVSTISLAMSSSRQRARVTASIKLGNGIISEAAYCYLNNKTINTPGFGVTICPGAGTWPKLPKQCTYSSTTLDQSHPLEIKCKTDTITCTLTSGKCEKKLLNP